MPLLKEKQHRNIAFWGMAIIAIGLPLSIFLVSVGTFVLAGNFLLQGNFKSNLQRFFKDPISLSVSAVFVLYAAGMLHTTDLAQGWKELRLTIPILAIPLFLFTSKLPTIERIHDLLKLFVLACVIGSFFGAAQYFELFGNELLNNRQLSVFISHIRFGLMVVLALFILIHQCYSNWEQLSVTEKGIYLFTMLWLGWFLIILEGFTAYLSLIAVLIFSIPWFIFKHRKFSFGLSGFVVSAIAITVLSLYIRTIIATHNQEVPFNYLTLTVKTLNGNYYAHQKDVLYRENGHRVWNFVCLEELRNEWPTRSDVDFDGLDRNGQPIKFTLVRYMTSKGLLKDSVGIHQLSDEDIEHIEAGFTNYLYTDKLGFSRRIDQLLWALEEYSWHRNANNSSAMQRWVYMEIGWEIFKKHPVFGVGTGDVINAYKTEYAIDDRGLEQQFQGISHNQFLTIAIALGTIGFALFLLSLAYPMWCYRSDFLFQIFMVIMLVSFMTDNTFSRQSGVALFSFFSTLLILRKELSDVK
jgi:hypothetical protein